MRLKRSILGSLNRVIGSTEKRYKRLLDEKIKDKLPHLAEHLRKHVEIGEKCSYTPEKVLSWDLGN